VDKKYTVLIVGGTFDRQGGKPSGLINKIIDEASSRNDIILETYNGGFVDELKTTIINRCKDNQITFWMPNVSNTEEKIRNVKEINPKTILISSKRNDNNKYSFAELITRALEMKSNLTIEFSKINNNQFNMMVFDPLGNEFYNGTDISKMTTALFNRAIKLTIFTRCPTIKVEDTEIPEVPNEEEFFSFARSCSEIFHNLINPSKETTRFLGNMSFRCQNGFPSFRGKDGIVFVSRRNVDKSQISKEFFVPTFLDENENVKYYGENKPSVDTPIQLRLYKLFPEMNYMIHAHCYFDAPRDFCFNTPFTYNPIPCGAIEEVDEIKWVANYTDDEPPEFLAINLIGHGCILMAKDVSYFTKLLNYKDNCFIKRVVPENTIEKFKQYQFDGYKKFNVKFSDKNNLSLKEFKHRVHNSKNKVIGMVEDHFCCYGSMMRCWQELYEVGCWGASRKYINDTLIEVYKTALETCPDRIFTARKSGKLLIVIVARDINKVDFRIYL
jgi:hypothetical protein